MRGTGWRKMTSPYWVLAALVALACAGSGRAGESEQERTALALAVDGEYDKAAEIFQQLLRSDPEQPTSLYYLGLCRYFQGDRQAGSELLAQAVEKGAPFPEAYVWLARLRRQEGDWEGARQSVAAGLARFPRHLKLRQLAGDWKEDGQP